MSMRRIISLVEARTRSYELPAKDKEETSRAFVRVMDAFERAEKKSEGSGPKAALDSVVRRVAKFGDDADDKRIGVIMMLKLMYASEAFVDAVEHKNVIAHQFVDEIPDWKFTAKDKAEIERILRSMKDDTYLDKRDNQRIW